MCVDKGIFMEIGKIKVTIPTFRAKIDNNKPLANLNEHIQDTFESSTDKKYNSLTYSDIYEMSRDIGDKKFSNKVKMAISKLQATYIQQNLYKINLNHLKNFL